MQEIIAIVAENRRLNQAYCQLRLALPLPLTVLPGQFAMLKPAGQFEPLLRRAMAFYQIETYHNGCIADFIFRIMGRGTEMLARLREGEAVELLGPLGQSFALTPAEAAGGALIVAGGIGAPAVLMLARQLCARNIPVDLFLGGRSQADLIGEADFRALALNLTITTDDGSVGECGFVTAPLERFLREHSQQRFVIYTCGPEAMMKQTVRIAGIYRLPIYASLEARMACGFGVCVGCVVETKATDATSCYQRVCVEGPVFDGYEVIW
ncbi:MAG: dihydroorotate dehydrogenase electron transfer subunit [Acidobacteriota bacterium]